MKFIFGYVQMWVNNKHVENWKPNILCHLEFIWAMAEGNLSVSSEMQYSGYD